MMLVSTVPLRQLSLSRRANADLARAWRRFCCWWSLRAPIHSMRRRWRRATAHHSGRTRAVAWRRVGKGTKCSSS